VTKTLQIVLEDETHRRFKLWCVSKGRQMSVFMKELISKCIEGFDPDDVIKQTLSVETCKHVELTTAGGTRLRLPLPNLVVKEGTHTIITVPDDTSDEDIEFIGTVPNVVVRTNKDWRTEIPMEVLDGA